MKSFAGAAWGLAALCLLTLFACSKPPAESTSRAVKFYQSPMHPWITSDKPGNCTICGMALVPVYEGDAGANADTNLVSLGDGSIRVLGVATVPVRRMDLTRTRRFSGTFEDDDNLHRVIAAFYDGRIEKVYVEHVGQYVTKGTPLAAIYSPELLYVVRELQTARQGGNAAVANTSARRLVQYGLSPEQVEALARQREPAYTIDLLAPADGTVLTRQAYQGQYIKTGEPLFETGNLSRLWFHADVYERDLPVITVGRPAVLTTPSAPGRDFPGVITFVDPNFDPLTRSTKVRIEVDNPRVEGGAHGQRYLIPHRAYGEARVTADFGEALVVPRSAVLRDGRRAVAYVEKSPGRYEPREVKIGRTGDEGLEVLAGLAEGERVVSEGNLLIDAEAQLRNNLPTGESDDTAAQTIAAPSAARELLERLARLSGALAADDLVSAAAASRELPASASALPADAPEAVASAIQNLQALKDAPHGEDLRAFRRSFLPWSEAGATLAKALRANGADPGVKVFACPMTGGSFPGAPARAQWVQATGETRNPYLGAEMLNCGEEVRP